MYALAKDNHQQLYNVGIYCRLSKEDENTFNESESISNQKEYLTRYVLEQGWNLVDSFADDGYTGTNFNRPAFNRLIKAIEDGKINLVITKDLSRLGRDYIDTGHYVERYFPQKNVRYIAVNDGVDTFERSNSNNDMSPFKSVMNDFYARDISKKVRTSMDTKRRNGQFIGAFAPYGYLKAPSDKNKLIIDTQVASTIKYIFETYLAGYGYAHIAHTLNGQGVPCPSVYKATILASNYKHGKALMGLWTTHTVKSILGNPTYTGDTAQRKYAIVSYKVKKLKALPKDSWMIVRDTHEALVDRESFEAAQRLMQTRTTDTINNPHVGHLLGGLLYCKDCGSKMTFTKTAKGEWYCICSKYKRFKLCSRHSFPEASLQELVFEDLRRIVKEASMDYCELLKEAQKETAKKPATTATNEIEKVEKRLAEIKRTIKALYEDKLKGILTEQDFMDLSKEYNKEREGLTKRLAVFKKSAKLQQQKDSSDELAEIIKDLLEFNNVSKVVLMKLIQRIEIHEDKNLDIYYNFKGSH